jgi:hypothetical protein
LDELDNGVGWELVELTVGKGIIDEKSGDRITCNVELKFTSNVLLPGFELE